MSSWLHARGIPNYNRNTNHKQVILAARARDSSRLRFHTSNQHHLGCTRAGFLTFSVIEF